MLSVWPSTYSITRHVSAVVAHLEEVAVEAAHDVLVRDLAADLRLAQEALEEVGAVLQVVVDDLQRHARARFQPGCPTLDLGEEDGPHPPGPELAKQAEGADSRVHDAVQ